MTTHHSTEGIEIEVSEVAACPGCAKRDAWIKRAKPYLTRDWTELEMLQIEEVNRLLADLEQEAREK